jgi:hypothetical protein
MLDEFATAAPRKRRKKTGEKATVETPGVKWLKARGYWVRKFKSIGNRSAPDRIIAKRFPRGKVAFFWEAKDKGKKPTELQLKEHEEMRAAGLEVFVSDNVEDLKAYVLAAEKIVNPDWYEGEVDKEVVRQVVKLKQEKKL